jgi:hypothetical protein
MANEASRIVATFENFPVINEARSKDEGRPIFDDMEVVRIHMGGDRLQAPVFPAWAEVPGGIEDEDTGLTRPGTYAEKYAKQYEQFKKGERQTKSGTPIEALPFLTPAKMKELKGLNIYTAEALADLDGQPLKTLGQGGRDWKNQAQAYLDNAAGSANVTKMASELEYYKAEVERMQKEQSQYRQVLDTERVTTNLGYGEALEGKSDDELKEYIEEKTGKRPRGNPSRNTLLQVAQELTTEKE